MFSRADFVLEAKSWIPTPYRRRAAIKHLGADCGSFLGAVLVSGGFIPGEEFTSVLHEIESLQDDWFLHKAETKYMELMRRYVPETKTRMTYGLPGEPSGNILLMQTANSKHRNHGGIVTIWPKLIHCIYNGVAEVNVLFDPMWSHKEVTIFDPWGGA